MGKGDCDVDASWKKSYRAISPAVAPAAMTCRREPSSLRWSPCCDIHPAPSAQGLGVREDDALKRGVVQSLAVTQ